ncbi:MAG: T9SS type A sorting domain-containing protein [Chitinispirillaceae bacterium]|nr:T9SS type A sorting domain-containing protein [Chitinispirillaceae bacterium]
MIGEIIIKGKDSLSISVITDTIPSFGGIIRPIADKYLSNDMLFKNADYIFLDTNDGKIAYIIHDDTLTICEYKVEKDSMFYTDFYYVLNNKIDKKETNSFIIRKDGRNLIIKALNFNKSSPLDIKIYNIAGREILSKRNITTDQKIILPIGSFAKGIYIVNIKSERLNKRERIVIK